MGAFFWLSTYYSYSHNGLKYILKELSYFYASAFSRVFPSILVLLYSVKYECLRKRKPRENTRAWKNRNFSLENILPRCVYYSIGMLAARLSKNPLIPQSPCLPSKLLAWNPLLRPACQPVYQYCAQYAIFYLILYQRFESFYFQNVYQEHWYEYEKV